MHLFMYKKWLIAIVLAMSFSGIVQAAEPSSNSIKFVENKGQWDNRIAFRAKLPNGMVWIEKDRITFDFVDPDDLEKLREIHHGHKKGKKTDAPYTIRHHAYRMIFRGAGDHAAVSGSDVTATYHNYYLGDNLEHWAGHVKLYNKVKITGLYPGIDVVFYTKNGNLKYDFIIAPEADPGQIEIEYDGIAPTLTKYGILKLPLVTGDIFERIPESYRITDGEREEVEFGYRLNENILHFQSNGKKSRKGKLVIDPELIFSTYTGSYDDNWGFSATPGKNGTSYSAGIIWAVQGQNNGYPTTVGAYDQTFNGGDADIVISKYNPEGTQMLYATYLGGSSADVPHSLVEDEEGNLIVLGATSSPNFPVTSGTFSTVFKGGIWSSTSNIEFSNGSDLFLTKFNADGTVLEASTFIGGSANEGLNINYDLEYNYGDASRGEVIASGEFIYVASNSQSGDFPVAGNGGSSFGGIQDGVAFCITRELDSLIWSLYLGGNQLDAAYSIKVKDSLTYVCGGTQSSDFPVSPDAYKPTYSGNVDGFVVALSDSGSIRNATFLGTGAYDQAYFLDIFTNGDVYIFGQTLGAYPKSEGVYFNSNGRQFIHALDAALTTTSFSTIFGSGSSYINISPAAFTVDDCGVIYLSGWGGFVNYTGTTSGLPVTSDAFQPTTDGSDFYFMVLSPGAGELLYATFFGGPLGEEHVDGGTSRFDPDGIIYQAVCASCGGLDDFPTTPGVVSNTNNSSNCNLALIKMQVHSGGLSAEISHSDPNFCEDPPFTISFSGSSPGAMYHFWDFGDGQTSTEINPQHNYTDAGSYQITYIVSDSNSLCGTSDTAYADLEIVRHEPMVASWTFSPNPRCVNELEVQMAFTGSNADQLTWNMGDGTIYHDSAITHLYTDIGIYEVTLHAVDPYCNIEETFTHSYEVDGVIDVSMAIMPNVFTPNDDGTNDRFSLFIPEDAAINPMEGIIDYHLEVYNRWGRLVFSSDELTDKGSWDGRIGNSEAKEGTYFYIVDFTGKCNPEEKTQRSGYVHLLR